MLPALSCTGQWKAFPALEPGLVWCTLYSKSPAPCQPLRNGSRARKSQKNKHLLLWQNINRTFVSCQNICQLPLQKRMDRNKRKSHTAILVLQDKALSFRLTGCWDTCFQQHDQCVRSGPHITLLELDLLHQFFLSRVPLGFRSSTPQFIDVIPSHSSSKGLSKLRGLMSLGHVQAEPTSTQTVRTKLPNNQAAISE